MVVCYLRSAIISIVGDSREVRGAHDQAGCGGRKGRIGAPCRPHTGPAAHGEHLLDRSTVLPFIDIGKHAALFQLNPNIALNLTHRKSADRVTMTTTESSRWVLSVWIKVGGIHCTSSALLLHRQQLKLRSRRRNEHIMRDIVRAIPIPSPILRILSSAGVRDVPSS